MVASASTRSATIQRIVATIPRPADAGPPVRVVFDGVDGAGKTVMRGEVAQALRAEGHHVIEVSIDDFHHPRAVRHPRGRDDNWQSYWNHAFNLARFVENVLVPLAPGGDRRYCLRCHDLRTDAALDDEPWHESPENAILLADAVLAQRPELREYWDFRVFVHASFAETHRRMAERDGCSPDPTHPGNARYYEAQQYYLQTYRPADNADVAVDNTDWDYPRVTHVP